MKNRIVTISKKCAAYGMKKLKEGSRRVLAQLFAAPLFRLRLCDCGGGIRYAGRYRGVAPVSVVYPARHQNRAPVPRFVRLFPRVGRLFPVYVTGLGQHGGGRKPVARNGADFAVREHGRYGHVVQLFRRWACVECECGRRKTE